MVSIRNFYFLPVRGDRAYDEKINYHAVIIFILWSVIDSIIHGFHLSSAYSEISQLWMPM